MGLANSAVISPGPWLISCSSTASSAVVLPLFIHTSLWLVRNAMAYQNGKPGPPPGGGLIAFTASKVQDIRLQYLPPEAYEDFPLIRFDEASRLICEIAKPLEKEAVPLEQADGRVLAESIVARRNSPSTAVSAMDGYALREADLSQFPVRLGIIGNSFAGSGFNGTLPAGTCVRIFTGAPLPDGADRVVVQEEVESDGVTAVFYSMPGERRHIRTAGSDFVTGDVLVASGTVLRPQSMVAAAAANFSMVQAVRRPRILIICCGDELVDPGSEQADDFSIPESISFGLGAMVRRWGGVVVDRWRKPDDLEMLKDCAKASVGLADIVVITGGASVGEKDFSKAMFVPLAPEFIFDKVAMKPGKPVWLARVQKTMVVGLPGNPTSALVAARLFLAPLVAGMSGRAPTAALVWRTGKVTAPLLTSVDLEIFTRARTSGATVTPLGNQDSAAQKALADADVLIRCRAGGETIGIGSPVETLVL